METEKKKLTDTQLRVVQAVAGVLCAAALMVTIGLSSSLEGLLAYSFVAIFLVITFGRRWIENKYRLRLNFFNLVLIDSIMAGILIYLIIIFYNPTIKSGLTEIAKLLIIIGVVLVILGLGIIFPYIRYRKRTEKGIIVPIRIPEKTEEEEEAERKANAAASGSSSLYRQIAEMKDELGIKEEEVKPAENESENNSEENNSENK